MSCHVMLCYIILYYIILYYIILYYIILYYIILYYIILMCGCMFQPVIFGQSKIQNHNNELNEVHGVTSRNTLVFSVVLR